MMDLPPEPRAATGNAAGVLLGASTRLKLARPAFAAALAVVAVLLLLPGEDIPDTGISDKLEHAFVFAVLGMLGCEAFPGWRRALLVGIGLCVFGVACEVLQLWVPGRSASLLDALADAGGVIVGGALAIGLRRWLDRSGA